MQQNQFDIYASFEYSDTLCLPCFLSAVMMTNHLLPSYHLWGTTSLFMEKDKQNRLCLNVTF